MQKTETALTSANVLINEQDKALAISKTIINAKDESLGTIQEVYKQDKIAGIERENQLKIDISYFKNEIEIMKIESKKNQRKKFWTGIKIGGVSVAILGAAGLIWLNNK
ncbi:hypothetical protein [Chryseobacterium sp.]|uniref:hypothetical protein n=1 Tax=Chryseobacterium sp. TaxID=1871047 RepID=UPI0024E19EBD|nr:hypothetical protein [Chryseobacterium sp.]